MASALSSNKGKTLYPFRQKPRCPIQSSADHESLSEPRSPSRLGFGLAGFLLVTRGRTIRTTIAVATTTSAAIKLNPIALARDAIAIASAGARRYRRRIAEGRERTSTRAGNVRTDRRRRADVAEFAVEGSLLEMGR